MRKAIIFLLGVALFALGTLLLVGYVRSAEERVIAQEQPIAVISLRKPVEAGDELRGSTSELLVPGRLANPDAVRPGDDLSDLVALVDLAEGEQLLWSRLGTPAEVDSAFATRGIIPAGHTAVTIRLDPERAAGGLLTPGMKVAVVGSFSLDLTAAASGVADEAIAEFDPAGDVSLSGVDTTHAMVPVAEVVEVQTDAVFAERAEDEGPAQSPDGDYLITLAVPARDAERIVFAAEWGTIWLLRHGPEADLDDTRIQTTASIYREIADLAAGDVANDSADELPEDQPEEPAPEALAFAEDGNEPTPGEADGPAVSEDPGAPAIPVDPEEDDQP